MIKVSIIVPIYNVEPYISRCLYSVMDQTYTGPMECLLVDDCGTDNSIAIVEQLIGDYHGPIDLKVLHHEHNRGLSAARNTGVDASSGDYVFFLDSDDAITSDCLALMVAEVEKHPGVEMVMGAHQGVYEDPANNYLSSWPSCYVEDNTWLRLHFFKQENSINVVAWNRLLKLSFIRDNGLRFKEGVIHEDEHWSFYVYRKLKSWTSIENVTYIHYLQPNSIMSTNTARKKAENIYVILCDIVKDFDEPLRSLQAFKYLEYFRFQVLPFITRKQAKWMYFRFYHELLRMKQYRVAFYWFVNWFHDLKHFQLYYQMLPGAYTMEEKKKSVDDHSAKRASH